MDIGATEILLPKIWSLGWSDSRLFLRHFNQQKGPTSFENQTGDIEEVVSDGHAVVNLWRE